MLPLWLAAPALAQDAHDPAETVEAHFQAILAEEYTQADEYFSAAFRRAFKADQRAQLDNYYLTRKEQLAPGYEILQTLALADPDHDTVVVIVEFGDPYQEGFYTVTERMHYYLVREKVEAGAPLADRDNFAWRIDIFDALRYDTLAEARRRPYLMTREAWPEDESRELISLQGMYRIQDALERFHSANGQYPFRLLGSDNRRDELIGGGYLLGRYPNNGFNGGPMRSQEFGNRSSGDFAYYSVDANGDGWREGYWLLLHGKVQPNYIFDGYDTIQVFSNLPIASQLELAQLFSQFWAERAGQALTISADLPDQQPLQQTSAALDYSATATQPLPGEEEPAVIGQPFTSVEQLEPIDISPNAVPPETEAAPAAIEDAPVETTPVAVEDVAVDEPQQPETTGTVPTVRELLAVTCGRLLSQDIQRHVSMLAEMDAETAVEAAVEPEPADIAMPEPVDLLKVYSFGW